MSAVDFGRGTFNAAQHYSSVSMQQGRVQLDADASEDSEANSEKIRRSTDADVTPIGDSATSTISTALAGFEPTGGLHPVAKEPGVALFAWLSQHLQETPKRAGQPAFLGDDNGVGDLSKRLQPASADLKTP